MSWSSPSASVVDQTGWGRCRSRHVAEAAPGYSKAVEDVGAAEAVGYSRTAVEEDPVEDNRCIPEVVADSSSREVAAVVAAEVERNLQDSCSMTCLRMRPRIVYMGRWWMCVVSRHTIRYGSSSVVTRS